ncbi:hypothetical protein LEP1GSC202_0739 [Leptospira yanagawae serovar Saopaulo str. Sao Paulo = ATCC 700523]|uniref:Uncharacterized protein n=1 Tax=Leptospira yanagawae serovar Saopaulo str. Sao Paulo = ATCC 700523 TaxID=1249483 RepID=A0A5E8HDZ6_9LEPT|nr:hypothetical protein LEP1GSC202_0739 [Leptospira yanagawae serovar Saopaulo str. Sao Paulo = ATCC 700523]
MPIIEKIFGIGIFLYFLNVFFVLKFDSDIWNLFYVAKSEEERYETFHCSRHIISFNSMYFLANSRATCQTNGNWECLRI